MRPRDEEVRSGGVRRVELRDFATGSVQPVASTGGKWAVFVSGVLSEQDVRFAPVCAQDERRCRNLVRSRLLVQQSVHGQELLRLTNLAAQPHAAHVIGHVAAQDRAAVHGLEDVRAGGDVVGLQVLAHLAA